jgi:hypothetical protein
MGHGPELIDLEAPVRQRRSSPTRGWVKRTGPGEVSLTRRATAAMTGRVMRIPKRATRMFRERRTAYRKLFSSGSSLS